MKIATSLSAALKEIVSGAVKVHDVNAVICGTNYPTLERAIASECLAVKPEQRKATGDTLKALWPRVIQPRQLGSHAPRANPKTFFEADSITAAFREIDRRALDGEPRYMDSEIPRRAENLWRQQNAGGA